MNNGYGKRIIVGVSLLGVISMIGYIAQQDKETTNKETDSTIVPDYLTIIFSKTDFSKVDPKLAGAMSGGPGKDGIPAIDEPKFIPLSEATYPDSVQAIVLTSDTETKIYPYNILTWHEIVNDTFVGRPVAVTFCPLCGSAIVYDRTLPNGEVSTFGVSGSLLESNMIMYDRATESLWQQSTGKTLAGDFFPTQLQTVSFQLQTLEEIRRTYTDALIMSSNTGYNRDYEVNPYSGYETDNRFAFNPSELNTDFPPKTIMAVFRTADQTPIAIPWLKLREIGATKVTVSSIVYNLNVTDTGELTIADEGGNLYPFYFEMWFSFAIQHKDKMEVVSF